MSSPLSRTRRVAILCAGFSAAVGLAAIAASSQTFAARVVSPAPTVVADVAADDVMRTLSAGHSHSDPGKLIFAKVRDGVYTVDGMVAKVRLNYDVNGANYMYLFLPGIGTAVISIGPDGKAVFSPVTLHQDELTFSVDGHQFNLSGVDLDTGGGNHPAHLFVHLDRSAWHVKKTPAVGFGNRAEMPYEWPGALKPQLTEESLDAPPVPASLLPAVAPATLAADGKTTAPQLQPVSLH